MAQLAAAGGKPVRTKPLLSWPVVGAEEEQLLLQSLRSGQWWYGERVREFEEKFAAFQNARFGITCCNGSVALEIAMRTVGIGPGDEVLVPSYTFVATAITVTQLNAVPVFVDVEANSANFDFDFAERLVNERTRALIIVHFGGLMVDMDRAREFAKRHNLKLIEDAAHAWGSKWDGKGAGAIGDIGTFSFQVSKNITAGEGGIILTDNEEHARTARSYTHCGRLEGEAWYEHFLLGGNYRITELQAALLIAQLGRLDEQTNRREANAAILNRELSKISGIEVQARSQKTTRRSYHMYIMRYDAGKFGGLPREKFISALEAEGIPASRGYLNPVYRNVCFRDLNDKPRPEHAFLSGLCKERGIRFADIQCPVSEAYCRSEMVWLPHVLLLEGETEMEQVIEAVTKIQKYQQEIS